MPDDEKIEQGQTEAAAQTQAAGEGDTKAPAIKDVETSDAPPQQIPYVRFKEINDRAKASEERERVANERIARLEAQQQSAQTQQPITIETVLTAYERGQITESQKDQWVLHLAKESAKQEFGQTIAQTATLMKAQGVVEQYAKAIPNVNDTSTAEFQELKATYQDLLNEGYPATVATQAKALRMTFGPIKSPTAGTREHSRQRADTFLEGAGGGGQMAANDPIKEASDRQQHHWKKQGYTKTRMVEEAKLRDVRSIEDYRRLAGKK